MAGLVVGGLVLLLMIALGGILLAQSADERDTAADSSDTVATTPRLSTTSAGPTTSAAGTGAMSAVNASNAASSLREKQQRATPDLTIGLVTCPPAPYLVGHVVVCRMDLGDATILYRVEITGEQTLRMEVVAPIVDTDDAEAVMEEKEPGATADCGEPRVRQVEVGGRITCQTQSYTWDFTVGPDGNLTGTTR